MKSRRCTATVSPSQPTRARYRPPPDARILPIPLRIVWLALHVRFGLRSLGLDFILCPERFASPVQDYRFAPAPPLCYSFPAHGDTSSNSSPRARTVVLPEVHPGSQRPPDLR